MKHSTPIKKWIRTLVLDTVLIGGFGYALHAGNETAQSIFAFFFWWMVAINLFFYFIAAVCGANRDVKDPETGEEKGEKLYNVLWSEKLVNNLAVSNTFMAYHILTDLLMITLLLLSGRWVLGSFKTFTFLGSLVLIQHARSLKEERQSVVA